MNTLLIDPYMDLIARFLISFLFIHSAYFSLRNYPSTLHLMQGKIPYPKVTLPISLIIKLGCGLAILFNFHTKIAAILLILFTFTATIIFHNFWKKEGLDKINETFWFTTNMAVIGGLLLLFNQF